MTASCGGACEPLEVGPSLPHRLFNMSAPAHDSFRFPRRDLQWAFLVTTAIAVLNFFTYFTESRNVGRHDPAGPMLINEFTGAYTFIVLLPFLYGLIQRWPLQRTTWIRRLPWYLLANLATGAAHTTLMTVSRKVIYSLCGYAPYVVMHPVYRYAMEFTKQLVIFWAVVGIYQMRERFRAAHTQRLLLVKMEKQLTDARLASLQMQLSPHFLFNTLNMISSIMYEQVEVADRMISHLSELLRSALDSSNRLEITLAEELEQLDHYLAIIRARFGDHIHLQSSIDQRALSDLVPPLLLQPLVENSVKHGMGKAKLTIWIEGKSRDHGLELEVRDDGVGLKGPLQEGTGLRSIRERLGALHGDHAKFSVRPLERGLSVQLLIPARVVENGRTVPK